MHTNPVPRYLGMQETNSLPTTPFTHPSTEYCPGHLGLHRLPAYLASGVVSVPIIIRLYLPRPPTYQ